MQLQVLTHTVTLTHYRIAILWLFRTLVEYLVEVSWVGERDTLKLDHVGNLTDTVYFSDDAIR